MLIIAWISSVIPFHHANRTKQVLVQGSPGHASLLDVERFESESIFEGRQQEPTRPSAWEEMGARLAWIAPVTIFACMACLAVFAWIVSWLDQR